MVNTTFPSSNMTQAFTVSNKTIEITKTAFVFLLLLSFCFFLYFLTVILNVYFTTPHIRDNARYVLFAHMLINDTLYLLVAMFLTLVTMYVVYLPVPFCFIIQTLGTSTFRITPYNLATMSLERYAAICHPLRHGELGTSQSATKAISVIWGVGLIPNLLDFIIMNIYAPKNFVSVHLICNRIMLVMHSLQNTIRLYSYIISFVLVGLIIVYTYIKVMLVARKIGSSKSTASKAGKTVMLHAFQLLLCMFSFVSTLTEPYLKDYFTFLLLGNFFLFTCLPRFLSPFIYGLRDELFRKYIQKMYSRSK
ncbi:odorant receptor 131-2-like [Bombina bombina]|uniref:odorant receptor 131-2-like n=1 Tax=Bombina bombina TaxID=8345 RepID=UPI00235A54BE|nr:odorant receptor 131-2-like [Bombina bombina]